MAEKSPTALAREAKEELAVLNSQLTSLQGEVERAQLLQLRERLAVVENQVAELRRVREEADRRGWQLVALAVGAVLALLGGVVVQLVAVGLRKP